MISSGKKYRKWFSRAGKYFSAKIDPPLILIMVSNSRKMAPNKSILFPLDHHDLTENKFTPVEMKDLLKNRFSLDVKVTFGEMCEETKRE